MNTIDINVSTGNAFIDEMRKCVVDNDGMFDVFYRTVQLIGTNKTNEKLHSLITRENRTMINDKLFIDRDGIITDELLFMIHDDIRMLNVHIDGECNIINGEEYSIDSIVDGIFESYLFVFLDDNDYDSLLSCKHIADGMNHEFGDVCKCGDIVMNTFMNVKRHAIMNRNSDDIVSATLIGTALMRE